MARFSLGGEDDCEGPSSPRPKKQRTTSASCTRPRETRHRRNNNEQEDGGFFELDGFIEEDEQVASEYQEEEEDEQQEGEEEEAAAEEEVVSDYHEEDGEDGEGEEEEDQAEGEISLSARVADSFGGKGHNRDAVEPSGDGSISAILTDLDVLDCSICLDPLSLPVFQCENGHIACSACCIKLGNKCPSCAWPIGYNRCRAIEKVLEAVKISCLNLKYGCKETMSYSKKHEHEETCIYAPCLCPIPDCNFVGSSKKLCLHFFIKHLNSATQFCYDCLVPISLELNKKYLILREQSEGMIFILNNGNELLGNVVNINCIGPSSPKRGFSYDLIARNGAISIRLQSFTESITRWVEHVPNKAFLLVPSDFVGSCGQLKLEICIRRAR